MSEETTPTPAPQPDPAPAPSRELPQPAGAPSLREELLRDANVKYWLPGALLVVIGFLVAYRFVEPAPPDEFVIAAGPREGAYYQHAAQYAAELQKEGVEMVVRETAGSEENLRLLNSGEASLAFVQGGAINPAEAHGLKALGSIYVEPLWVLHRLGTAITHLRQLQGKRLACGTPGSGTLPLVQRLLALNGLSDKSVSLVELGGTDALAALRARKVDAAFIVISAQKAEEYVHTLPTDVKLMSFARADAYTARLPFLIKATLPAGVLDMADDIPAHDVTLVSPTATLVAREDLHRALTTLVLTAARDVINRPGRAALVRVAERFPSPEHVDVPLSDTARRFFRRGPSFLFRWLPFWLASDIDRLKVLLVPLITLLVPLIRFGSPIYRWRIRARIYRWYHVLRDVDQSLRAHGTAELASDIEVLRLMEREISEVWVPLAYMEELYDLRLHVKMVLDDLLERHTPDDDAEPGPEPSQPDSDVQPT